MYINGISSSYNVDSEFHFLGCKYVVFSSMGGEIKFFSVIWIFKKYTARNLHANFQYVASSLCIKHLGTWQPNDTAILSVVCWS